MARKKKSSRKRSTTSNPTTRRRRRRAPAMATRRRRTYRKISRRRRRRNPSGGFTMNLPGLGPVNLVDVGGGTLGSVLAKMLPNYVATKVGIPVTGVMKYPVQLASGLFVSWVAGNLLKQKGIAKYTALFTLSNVLTDLVTEYVVNPAGLGSMMLGYPYTVLNRNLSGGMVKAADTPTVLYQPAEQARDLVVDDVPSRYLPRF